MENNNVNEGFDKLMAKYDFDSPIKVTLVIEEEDQPDPFSIIGLLLAKESNISNTNTDNAQIKIPNANNIRKSNSIIKENNQSINKSVLPEQIQEKTQDIRCRLLDFVADNLICITKYYFDLCNNNKQLGNDKKLQYLNFKHHFFNLSYSTTITILLPQQYNIPFLNNFIHRVIKIANDSSWYQISFNSLEILVREMLIWTKQKKRYHELNFRPHNHGRSGMDCRSTAFTVCNSVNRSEQDLNRPLYNDPRRYYSRQGNNGQPDIVLKTYHPTRKINILPKMSDTTNYLTQKMTSPPNIRSRSNDLPQNIVNSPNNGHIQNNSGHKRTELYNICRKHFHSKQEINISPYFTQRPNRLNRAITASFNTNTRTNNPPEAISHLPFIYLSRINEAAETIPSISYSEPKANNFNNYQIMNTITNNKEIFVSIGPNNQKITISVDPAVLANINRQNKNQINNNAMNCHKNEAYGMESIKRRKTKDDHNNINNSYHQKDNCSATTLKSHGDGQRHDDSLRSSISRDSGCGGSPIYGSCHDKEMIGPLVTEEQVTPVISHVTSINPNAVKLNSGSCTVCGVITCSMCIGCYQKYYCSSLCQMIDWDSHKYLCRR